jgi:phage FluMu gp28-like protein
VCSSDLAEKYGTYRVEPVRFTAQVKEALAYPVRAAFEDKSVKIPHDDKIRADLRAIRKTTTAAGNIRFLAESGPDGHSDRFWALALAIHAASDPAVQYAYHPVRRAGRNDEDNRPVKVTAGLGRCGGLW